MSEAVRVLDDAKSVGAALTPQRQRILKELREEDSATSLGERLGLTRQKVNYHLRQLESAGLVELAFERPRRGCTERVYRPSARAFVVDPAVIGAAEPAEPSLRDRFSSAFLVTSAARILSHVAAMRERALAAGKKLLTQTFTTEVAFETPQDLEAFTDELARELARLAAKHGSTSSSSRRKFQLTVFAHPTKPDED